MQNSSPTLSKRAIDASLKGDWKEAIELNNQILDKNPKDLDAMNRLGRAYIQISDFTKAKKIFKAVLEIDPINTVAQKNYKLASEKKIENRPGKPIDPKGLIKEPGTTAEVTLDLEAPRITTDNFHSGEELILKVNRSYVEFYKQGSHNKLILIGKINSNIAARVKVAKQRDAEVSAFYQSGKGKRVHVLIKSSVSVFRGERQEVKPYIKRGTLEEPEIEIPSEYTE